MLSLTVDPVSVADIDPAALTAALDPARNNDMRDGLVAAAAIYLGFTRQRFLRAARGDGTWVPLAASTIRRRRKGKRAGGKVEILRDTGILFNSLSAGGFGSVQRPISWGIEVGTNVKYAKYHQRGGSVPGRPPQRTILVPPDAETVRAMNNVLQQACNRAIVRLKG